jgi:hypothetical protein
MRNRPELAFRNFGIAAWSAGMIGMLAPVLRGDDSEPLWPPILVGGVIMTAMGVAALANVRDVRGHITARYGGYRRAGRSFGSLESVLFIVVGLGWLGGALVAAL